jgi:hypothetical protein
MDPTALTGNISPTAAVSPSLVGLSPEVTENIARHLKNEYDGENEGWVHDDFRALRLTCKDLYLKTFRLYGITYFTDVSVVLTKHSLERLRKVATSTNGFGLSLSSFPNSITCSTYRLPSGDKVGELLMPERDLVKGRLTTQHLIHSIGFACRATGGRYLPRLDLKDSYVKDIVDAYLRTVKEQQSMDGNGYDVRGCDANTKAWGQLDWSDRASILNASFSHMDHAVSGKSNLTTTAERVLRAIGQASVICQYEGRHLHIQAPVLYRRSEIGTRRCGAHYVSPKSPSPSHRRCRPQASSPRCSLPAHFG